MKDITITIKTDGATNIEANGFQGVGCKAASQNFEMALAGMDNSKVDTDPKPEMYQQDFNTQHNYGQ